MQNLRKVPVAVLGSGAVGCYYGGRLALSALLIFIVAALDTLAPWPIKFIVDNVIGGKHLKTVLDQQVMGWLTGALGTDQRVLTAVLGLSLLGLTVLQGLAGFGFEYLNGLIKERTTFRLRSDVFGHVQRLPLEFYDQEWPHGRPGEAHDRRHRQGDGGAALARTACWRGPMRVAEASALSAKERSELEQLRKEVRRLQTERDILAKATAWFAGESGHGSKGSTR